MRRALLCVALLIQTSVLAHAAEFTGKVIAVMDGDTLLVLRGGQPVKVRLAEIDAPEKDQPFGTASRESLAEMVKGKLVRVTNTAVDDYGRLIATVHSGEINVNREQVNRGMAWEYSRYHSNKELAGLQREAQDAGRGLWAEAEAIEPSKWRKQHAVGATAAATALAASTPERNTPTDAGQECQKKYCAEMSSCEEAIRHFTQCSRRGLDGDADGKPCESLCSPVDKTAGKGDRADH